MSVQIYPDPQRSVDAGPDSYVVLVDGRVVRRIRIHDGITDRAPLADRLRATFGALLEDGLGRETAARALAAWHIREAVGMPVSGGTL